MIVDKLLFPDSHDETGTTYCGIAGTSFRAFAAVVVGT